MILTIFTNTYSHVFKILGRSQCASVAVPQKSCYVHKSLNSMQIDKRMNKPFHRDLHINRIYTKPRLFKKKYNIKGGYRIAQNCGTSFYL